MSKIKNWFKRQATALVLASAKVEKNALSQEGKQLEDQDSQGITNPAEQSSMLKALEQGQVNEQVRQLRWRMYKVEREADRYKVNFEYNADKDEYENITTEKTDNKDILKEQKRNVTLEPSDEGELDLVFKNKSSGDKWSWSDYEVGKEENVENIIKETVPLIIDREHSPSFYIEKYTDSLYVRDLEEGGKLLEFFIPKYPDYQDNIQKLFVNNIKKLMSNPKVKDYIDFDKVGFVTKRSTLGEEHSKAYSYIINKFYKIVEYGAYYVVKFYGTVETNGEDLFEQYRNENIDEKYENVESKNRPAEVDFEQMKKEQEAEENESNEDAEETKEKIEGKKNDNDGPEDITDDVSID